MRACFHSSGRWWVAALFAIGAWALAGQAAAYPSYRSSVPNAYDIPHPTDPASPYQGCLTCHDNGDGGYGCAAGTAPCLNDFGVAFQGNGYTWNAALRDADSDGDGRTNGQELVYFGSSYSYPADDISTFDAYLALPGWAPADAAPGSVDEVHTNECYLQSAAGGGTAHPSNYTNCSTSAATICTDNSSNSATPSGRYFGFSCSCSSGYTGNGRRDVGSDSVADPGASGCSDVNECATSSRCLQTYPANSCANSPGSFNCTCGAGFTEINSGTLSENCQDINECGTATTCNANLGYGSCMNTTGGYNCSCNSGYQISGSGLSATCQDIDECATATTCNANLGYGSCANTIGSYSCTCGPGFAFDGTTCVVDNECTAGLDDCDMNALCSDTPTSFACTCVPGYVGDGHTGGTGCSDVNECATATTCNANLGYGSCTNLPGTYVCSCASGYAGPPTGGTCSDVDECATGLPCGVNGDVCTNTTGSYTCTCQSGYEAPPAGGTCSDTNECATATTCNANLGYGSCTNTPGTYICSCASGFFGPASGGTCADIDECDGGNPCAPGSCSNTVGAYDCTCPIGFNDTGTACVDIDECAPGPCGPGVCTEGPPPTYTCACFDGYVESGGTCVDIDECATMSGLCDPHASCANIPGTYTCTCDAGWEGSGEVCTDVNECAPGFPNECDVNAVCSNSAGTYTCTCRAGYVGSGVTCADDDECARGTFVCGDNEVCVNHVGSPYTCDCAAGAIREVPDGPCLASCGNGLRVAGEECDDGNEVDGDGCSALCEVEPGYACFEDTSGLSTCSATCGDGLIDARAGEECDDAAANSDTEPNACRTRCLWAYCGDGVLDTGEVCDDGGSNSDSSADACRSTCDPAYCGDGVIDTGEVCDPGGALPGVAEAGLCTTLCAETPDGGPGGGIDPRDPPVATGGACAVSRAGGRAGERGGSGAPLWGALALLAGALFLRRRRR